MRYDLKAHHHGKGWGTFQAERVAARGQRQENDQSRELSRSRGALCAGGTGVHGEAGQWQCLKSHGEESGLCPGAVGSHCSVLSRKMRGQERDNISAVKL